MKFSADAVLELTTLPEQECADKIAEYQGGFTWLHRPDVISIAAVQGHAIGAGFHNLLCRCVAVLERSQARHDLDPGRPRHIRDR